MSPVYRGGSSQILRCVTAFTLNISAIGNAASFSNSLTSTCLYFRDRTRL